MRNDLSAAFLAAMANSVRAPIQLMQLQFDSGTVYLSDRDLSYGGNVYQGLVMDWGELRTVGNYTEENSGTMEITISIWNGGEDPFSNLFFYQDPMNVEVSLYQTFDGLGAEDLALIGTFVIQDPIRYAEADQTLELTLVTANLRYFAQCGKLLTKEEFPYALEEDLNKPINLIFGDAGEVQTLCSNTPPRSILSGSILKRPTRVYVQDGLDISDFHSAGYLQIDEELMRYNWKTSQFFNVDARGVGGTLATDHSDGVDILQGYYQPEYIVGEGPLSSISNVKVNGQTPTVNYTTYPNANPAYIKFERQPTFIEYSKGARSTEIDFDQTASDNNALFPQYAWDKTNRSKGAILSGSNFRLSVNQLTAAEDDGELIKVFLCVEHWATRNYSSDRVAVNVEDIGLVGWLDRPNDADEISLTGDVDIDHPHDHEVGGQHTHADQLPLYDSEAPYHTHSVDTFNPIDVSATPAYWSKIVNAGQGSVSTSETFVASNLNGPLLSGKWRILITISRDLGGTITNLRLNPSKPGVDTVDLGDNLPNGTHEFFVNLGDWGNGDFSSSLNVSCRLYGGTSTGYSRITVSGVVLSASDPISSTGAKVKTEHATTNTRDLVVHNQNQDITGKSIQKDINDIDPLSTANRAIQNIITQNSSKAVVQKFDLTQYLQSITWDWMQNRNVNLRFHNNSSAEDPEIIITYLYFEAEYRQKQVRTTDNVTASVIGHKDSGQRPDEVIQYLLTQKAGVPESALGSVWRDIPDWNDSNTWDDNALWLDGGQVSDVPEGALFEEAASWFDYHSYQFDGVIPANISVKEALEIATWQSRSRLFWQNGKVKLAIRRKTQDWNIAKELNPSNIQLRSFAVEKSPVDNIINRIDLFHDIDRLSEAFGSEQYRATAFESDKVSIARHGERKKDEMFLFDLIRNQTVANHIADYYIWALGETTTYYSFNAYLENFDLEKDDYLTITSQKFATIRQIPVVVRDLVRRFGNGKTSQINLLQMIGEAIRYIVIQVQQEDEIYAYDALKIEFGFDLDFDDLANITDDLLVVEGKEFESEALVDDQVLVLADFDSMEESTAILSDSLAMHHEFSVESSFSVQDQFVLVQELCFGACGFGCPDGVGVFFGSRTTHRDYTDEYIGLDSELLIEFGQSGLESEAIAEDVLVFSDGFGCPTGLGSGFGISPFGDPC